jgi:hypothetical protein
MRQTWHIFLKDARRLRYEVIVTLVLTAAYAWSQGQGSVMPTPRTWRLMQAANLLRAYLLPMGWWFLASVAVYGEPLPGDRQFWVTRPYRWSSLLGAKLLFIIAFVSFPLLLADCFILLLQGLRPWENPVGLLWHELAIFAVILLPMMAVACITANFGQAVLVALATVVPILVFGRFFGPFLGTLSEYGANAFAFKVGGGTDSVMGIWAPLACLVMISAALVIMIFQYRARRTGVSRLIFVAAVLLVLCGGRYLPDDQTFALQSPLFKSRVDTSSITAVFSPESSPPPTLSPAPQNAERDDFTRVKLPIRFDGAPLGTAVVVEMMLAEVTPPNGKPWNTLLYFGPAPPDAVWHEAEVDRSLFDQVKGTPVRVHLNIQLTVLGNPHTQDMPLGEGSHRVPGVGLCESLPFAIRPSLLSLNCRVAFRQSAYVMARFDGSKTEVPRVQGEMPWVQWRTHYSPYPADFGIDPISDSNWFIPKGATSVAFTTMKPLAHIRRELDIPNVQLAEFGN